MTTTGVISDTKDGDLYGLEISLIYSLTGSGKLTGKNVLYGNRTLDSGVVIEDKFMVTVHCPFCFYGGFLYQFLIVRKKGEIAKRGECPDCNKGMLISTLTQDMTPEEYGAFVYNYCLVPNGYEKISWNKLKDRVYRAGIATEFWHGFSTAKREHHKENPTVEEQYKDFLAGLKTG
jgi:hypothetical protein